MWRRSILGAINRPFVAAGGGRHAIVDDWESRIIGNGGAVSENTLDYADTFVNALDTAGILSSMRRVNLCAGDDLAASLTPLINTAGATSDTGVSMTSGDYSESLGWTTDGSNDYINTGYTPTEATGGLSVYIRTAIASGTPVLIGCRNSGFNQYFYITRSAATAWLTRYGSTTLVQYLDADPAEPGFYHVARTSSTYLQVYWNGSGSGTGPTTTSTTPADPSQAVYVMCSNNGGTAGSFCPSGTRIAGYAIDSGLDATGAADLYDAMQAFNTSLSRNV